MKKIIVVGCGLCGGVIARQCAEAGFKVSIIERRDHIAGNLFDYHDEHGILIQNMVLIHSILIKKKFLIILASFLNGKNIILLVVLLLIIFALQHLLILKP